MRTPLHGLSALVLGANGRIGNEIAWALGTAGAGLTIAARNGQHLDALKADLTAAGIVCRAMPTDIADDDQIAALVHTADHDGLDIAVNNAGVAHLPAPLDQLDMLDIDRVLSVTLRGVMIAMKHQLGALRNDGALVNVVSTAGLSGSPGMSAYVAAKHGVVGLTRTAALDYADRGIRVNAVAPGAIESGPITHQPQEMRARVGSFAPLGRLGQATEVASAVAWLASPEASFTTGAVLTVDGGKGARGA
jgi:NAD(P)-dependent dehydrogenase (short-subunit alcohol dehydrogenase family)